MKSFKNSANRIEPRDLYGNPTNFRYGYDKPSPLLYVWSRQLQSVLSQSITFMITGKFHNRECGIYKCDGGCNIVGYDELVLLHDSCYWNNRRENKHLDVICSLITRIVVEWNPNDPIDSMVRVASDFVGCSYDELYIAIKGSRVGDVFGGNALSRFFNHNPFGKFKVDKSYERFCLVKFNGMSEKEVDRDFTDEKLGDELLQKMIDKIRKANPKSWTIPLCCSPRRHDGKLIFWINTGRSTQIDGWKTEQQINDFLKSDGILKDESNW